jgi:hypothetical protein
MASRRTTTSPDKTRKSGAAQAEEVTRDEAAALDESIEATMPEDPKLPEDPTKQRPAFRSPGFSRMRTEWYGEDAITMRTIQGAIDERILHEYADAYQIMADIFDLVREPLVEGGDVQYDRHGFPMWRRNPNGSYVEDWTRLTAREKEGFLFSITTKLFGWEERAAKAWTEAMFAKAKWEENFSGNYREPVEGTIEDRTAYAKEKVAEDRYFAVFVSAYSRRAEAIARTMNLIAQRLKDTLAGSG